MGEQRITMHLIVSTRSLLYLGEKRCCGDVQCHITDVKEEKFTTKAIACGSEEFGWAAATTTTSTLLRRRTA